MKVLDQLVKEKYALYHGDNVELIKGIPDNSIHYSIFSPPFNSLYTFSNSERDMSNSGSIHEFWQHFRYLINELYRVIMPGRLVSIHCTDLPTTINHDGFIGLKDFSGEVIRQFEEAGFYYHSRVTIEKDPLVAATRTHALGLLHKQIVKDSSMCRQGLADYIITMRKPGDNPEPISHPDGFTRYIGTKEIDPHYTYSHQVWRAYANPVWDDIKQTVTLNTTGSKDNDDERHICPLQLDVVERCIELWSNPDDIVFDPFCGIGTVPYCAIKNNRRGLGFELKKSYYNVSLKNLKEAEFLDDYDQTTLFDFLKVENE